MNDELQAWINASTQLQEIDICFWSEDSSETGFFSKRERKCIYYLLRRMCSLMSYLVYANSTGHNYIISMAIL